MAALIGFAKSRLPGSMSEFKEVQHILSSSRKIHIHVGPPQEHSGHLLSKEWLVKIDNEKSVPYLMVRPSFMVKLWHARRLWLSPSRSYTQLFPINHASS